MINVGDYVLEECLYKGNRFKISRGKKQSTQQNVIFKTCTLQHPFLTDITTLQHEYAILKQLNHPGIVTVVDFLKTYDQIVLVLEDSNGVSLRNYLDQNDITIDDFFCIALSLIDIIEVIHAKFIIHKDLNPNNIIIDPKTKNVKIIDFSIASQFTLETQEGFTVKEIEGTLAYMSPEQTGRINHTIDYRTDFYSLGLTFYEMLAGVAPFKSEDVLELIYCHLAKKPPLLNEMNPHIPYMIAAIINKLIAKIPEERYSSASGVKADLLKCYDQWQTNKKICTFQLALHDIQHRLIISQKLYGREHQVKLLLNTFNQINKGGCKLLFISGYSGSGKTSLVREIYQPVALKHGYTVSGKFDQLRRTIPFSALIEAFKELVHLILTESEERIAELKLSLLETIGPSIRVLIDVIPELALIVGEQPCVSPLTAQDSQHRFSLAFQNLVCVLSRKSHPLVIFLDDLQWIDNASLHLLEKLLALKYLKYFLLIGAYRSNEVDESHPINLLLLNLNKQKIFYQHVELNPLTENDIQQLLQDTFIATNENILPFVQLIAAKTEGNPFFINEFLKKIFRENLLNFSYQDKSWHWDFKKIEELDITDNVVDLVIARIHQFSEPTQHILELAACIGHKFYLNTLQTISELNSLDLAQAVQEAIKGIFISPIDKYNHNYAQISRSYNKGQYQFTHDRVQQAAYQLIPNEIKQQIHLKIARLLTSSELTMQTENLFEIVNHFNKGLSLIVNNDEKNNIALYNLWAGKKAKNSTAFLAAKEYFQAGLHLLSKEDKNTSLYFELTKELAITQYLTGDLKKAEKTFNYLLIHSPSLLKKMEIYKLNCEMLSTLNRHQEALSLGLRALRENNIYLPRKPNKLHIFWNVLKISTHRPMYIKFFPMTSEKYKSIIALVNQLLNSAYIVEQPMLILLTCLNTRLSIKHGFTESTTFTYLIYAFVLMHAFNLSKQSMSYVEIYHKLTLLTMTNHYAGKNHFVLGTVINPWRAPLFQSHETLIKGYYYSLDSGDIVYSNYCNLLIILTTLMLGKPLEEINKSVKKSIGFIKKNKINDFRNLFKFCKYFYECLQKNIYEVERIEEFEKNIILKKNNTEICFLYSLATKLTFILGDYEAAIHFGAKFEKMAEFNMGFITRAEGLFYYALALALTNAPNALKVLKCAQSKFLHWSKWAPMNFQQYLSLINAEIARQNRRFSLARQLYNDALTDAENQNANHLVALINECLARFYLQHHLNKEARLFILDAHYGYEMWGAITKCEMLEAEFPELFLTAIDRTAGTSTTTSIGLTFESIDILSLLKSTQAISSEIQLDKLLGKLLIILLQNAGAERGVLLIKNEERWFVEAEGTIHTQKIILTQAENLENRRDLPHSLIRYVQRTEEAIALNTISELTPYMLNDAYLKEKKPQSALVMPILFQGRLQNLLYLENNSTSNAFRQKHIHILQVLSSQAAISIENARLYYQATHDPLTGLCNRNFLYQKFYAMISHNQYQDAAIAILFFDLDNFKAINDGLGHNIGDKVLINFGNEIKNFISTHDIAVRLGGDEFIIMLTNADVHGIKSLLERMLKHFSNAFIIDNHKVYTLFSIGIAIFPKDGSSIAELINNADIALYQVKAAGKNSYQFYSQDLAKQIEQNSLQEKKLRRALENNEFQVYYQPIYAADTLKLIQMEALIRWQPPDTPLIEAKKFISLAEKTELIIPMTEWVIRTVCQQIHAWISKGVKPVPVAVNISGLHFKRGMVGQLTKRILKEENLDPSYLEFEFTESVFIDYTKEIIDDINAIKQMGISLSLDDFGTHYSSLSCIRILDLDKIKIDQSFIHDINFDIRDNELIIGIIAMAHNLNLQVIAEGVETEEQLEFLKQNKVDAIQGYLLSPPMSSFECIQVLNKN